MVEWMKLRKDWFRSCKAESYLYILRGNLFDKDKRTLLSGAISLCQAELSLYVFGVNIFPISLTLRWKSTISHCLNNFLTLSDSCEIFESRIPRWFCGQSRIPQIFESRIPRQFWSQSRIPRPKKALSRIPRNPIGGPNEFIPFF